MPATNVVHLLMLVVVPLAAGCHPERSEDPPRFFGTSVRKGELRLSLFADDATQALPPSARTLHEAEPRESGRERLEARRGPYLCMPFCGGTLVGTNRGEFGGGLYWVREDGNELRQTLEGTPVIAFLADDEHVLVFLGISHGGRSEGSVLLLEPDTAAERPRLRHWYPLPSEPIQLQLDGTRLRMAFLQSRTSWAHDMYAWNDTTPRDSGPPLLDGWDEILDAVLEDGTFRFPAAPR